MQRRTVVLTETPMTVGELAEAIDKTAVSVIKYLMVNLGAMSSISQSLDAPTCKAVAERLEKHVVGDDDDLFDNEDDDK